MVQELVYADGEEVQAPREVARETKAVNSIGISEMSRASVACLYNSNLLISTAGEVAVHHRN